MSWDPKIYMAFANERTRPAAELLSRVPNENPKRVADLGCGPGNSTKLLVTRWPEADVEGVESSQDMLDDAKASGVKARWTLADVAQWKVQTRYDVLFSNATLQWLDDHEHLLPRLLSYVEEGGTLAFQMPRNFDAPSHRIMREVAAEGPWSAKLRGVRKLNVGEPDFYFDVFSKCATSLDIWETTYLQVMEGDDPVYRWVSGMGLRPFAQALEGEEREAYLSEYRARLRAAYPRRADGKTLFPFQRLFVVAQH